MSDKRPKSKWLKADAAERLIEKLGKKTGRGMSHVERIRARYGKSEE